MQRVYVVINRTTGFVYGVTQKLERAQKLLNNAIDELNKQGKGEQIVSWTDEPILL